MKYRDALKIINNDNSRGFIVCFAWVKGIFLSSDHFPDQYESEKPIPTEEEAWELARKFANKTKGKCVEIYVAKANYTPVKGWKSKLITNR